MRNPTPTLTLPLKGEGILHQLRNSYPDSDNGVRQDFEKPCDPGRLH